MRLNAWTKKLDRVLWQVSLERMPAWERRGIRSARMLYVLGRNLASGQLT